MNEDLVNKIMTKKKKQAFLVAITNAGGDNWAKKHGKWHRTTVCEQLLPEIEKDQSVTPQTTKYRYRTVISDQWIHWKFKKKSFHSNITFVNICENWQK